MIPLRSKEYPIRIRRALSTIPAETIAIIEEARRHRRRRQSRFSALPPSFSPTLLPEGLRPWIIDEASRMGVSIEAVAVPAIVSAAAIIGSTAKIQVKRHDEGWTEPANLWGLIVGFSGLKKTPALNAGSKFAKEISRIHRDDFGTGQFRRSARKKSVARQMKVVEGKLGSAESSDRATLEAELEVLLAEEASVLEEPPRLVTNDPTMEKLAMLIEANPRGMLLVRDEIDGLFNTMDNRSGHEGDRAFFTEAYSADADFTFDRVGRRSTHTYPLTLSICGGIQPSVLAKHTRSLDAERGGDGFFARFQLLITVAPDTAYFGEDNSIDVAAEEQAAAIYRVMDAEALATVDHQPRGNSRLVKFNDSAQEHFDAWRRRNEEYGLHEEVTANGAFAAYHAKSSGTAARLALVMHLIDGASGDPSEAITLDQARRATEMADYFIAHAKVLYSNTASPHEHLAQRITNRIRKGDIVDGTKVADVRQLFSGKEVNTRTVRAALQHLERQGLLTIETQPNPGAPPSELLRLNATAT